MASVETDRGVKEQLRLYDTRGLEEEVELPKHYISLADGFVLVYAVNSLESFQRVELLKREIDAFRDKKEVKAQCLNNFLTMSTRNLSYETKLAYKEKQVFSQSWMISCAGKLPLGKISCAI